MSPGHLARFGHRQEMQMEKDVKSTVGFRSRGRGEWKQEVSGGKEKRICGKEEG